MRTWLGHVNPVSPRTAVQPQAEVCQLAVIFVTRSAWLPPRPLRRNVTALRPLSLHRLEPLFFEGSQLIFQLFR